MTQRAHRIQNDASALEAAAASARTGFACMFSTSDEYEAALIAERRAQGRYGTSHDRQGLFLIAAVLVLAATGLAIVL